MSSYFAYGIVDEMSDWVRALERGHKMESLLRGMASSTDSGGGHSPELKKAFLTKMLSSESLYDAVTSVQEVTALLR